MWEPILTTKKTWEPILPTKKVGTSSVPQFTNFNTPMPSSTAQTTTNRSPLEIAKNITLGVGETASQMLPGVRVAVGALTGEDTTPYKELLTQRQTNLQKPLIDPATGKIDPAVADAWAATAFGASGGLGKVSAQTAAKEYAVQQAAKVASKQAGADYVAKQSNIIKIALSKDPVEISTFLQTAGVPEARIPLVSRIVAGLDDPKKITTIINSVVQGEAKMMLEQKQVQLELLKDLVASNPLNENRKNDRFLFKEGDVVELGDTKGKISNFIETRMAEAGYTDPQKFVEDYLKLREDKVRIKELTQEVKQGSQPLKYSAEGVPMALTVREKAIVDSSNVPQTVSQIQGSQGEVRSLELAAQQAEALALGQEIPSGVSSKDIIAKIVTPVTAKVNIIDTYLRTPPNVMEKIGFGKEGKELRTAMLEISKELPKYVGTKGTITNWLKELGPVSSQERVFDFLDGKALDLTPVENKVAGEIKNFLAEWADRLHLPEDNRISHYITHIFDDTIKAQEFDEELAKIIAGKIPGEVYDPFLIKRMGELGYKRDLGAALDAYVKRAVRKVHMDPVLETIREKTGSSLATSKIETSQFRYIQRYIDGINMRPTDFDKGVDNWFRSLPWIGNKLGPRPVARVTRTLRRWTYRAMIGLNLSSTIRNFSQGINTYAVLGEKYTAIGYASLFKRGAFDEAVREGVLNAGIIEDRVLSSTKKAIQMFDKGLYIFFETAERINRASAYFGAKTKALSQGKTEQEAIQYGLDIVAKTQFLFTSVDTPVGLNGDVIKIFTQLQSFTVKQIEFLGGMVKDSIKGDAKAQNFMGLLRYALGGLIFTYTIGEAFGMKPSDLLPWYRFDTPASLKTPATIAGAVMNTPDAYGNTRDTGQKVKDVAETLPGLIPGGIQIKKTLQGIGALQQGKSTTASGASQFPVGGSLLKDAQAVAFGKYAGGAAQDYFSNDTSYAEAKYKELKASPTAEADFDKIIKEDPALAKSILAVIKKEEMGITPEQKKLLGLGVANKQRATAVYEELNKLKTDEEKGTLWEEYIKKKILTAEVAKQVTEMIANPPKKTGIMKTIINNIFGIKTASAQEMPSVWIRNNEITSDDLNEARAVLFGEVSNRSIDKQMLEAQTILNTAFNRMDVYAKRGNPKTLTEVLQMDNQYQAYLGKQYDKYKSGKLEKIDQQKVDAINAMIAKVQDGTFQNNIGNYVFYAHKPDGRIYARAGSLFKELSTNK